MGRHKRHQFYLYLIVIMLAVISTNCPRNTDTGILPNRIINIADHVVINEVELNPSGRDSGYEWVELYNPTCLDIDISGWTIKSTGGGRTEWISIPAGTIISASGFFCYTHYKQWLGACLLLKFLRLRGMQAIKYPQIRLWDRLYSRIQEI